LFYAKNSKKLSFYSDDEISELVLRIFDINGRLIKVKNLYNLKEFNWSLQFLDNGFYVASIKINDKTKNLKFVIN
jgi:hypothetical protein